MRPKNPALKEQFVPIPFSWIDSKFMGALNKERVLFLFLTLLRYEAREGHKITEELRRSRNLLVSWFKRPKLMKNTGLTEWEIRAGLKKLKAMGLIKIEVLKNPLTSSIAVLGQIEQVDGVGPVSNYFWVAIVDALKKGTIQHVWWKQYIAKNSENQQGMDAHIHTPWMPTSIPPGCPHPYPLDAHIQTNSVYRKEIEKENIEKEGSVEPSTPHFENNFLKNSKNDKNSPRPTPMEKLSQVHDESLKKTDAANKEKLAKRERKKYNAIVINPEGTDLSIPKLQQEESRNPIAEAHALLKELIEDSKFPDSCVPEPFDFPDQGVLKKIAKRDGIDTMLKMIALIVLDFYEIKKKYRLTNENPDVQMLATKWAKNDLRTMAKENIGLSKTSPNFEDWLEKVYKIKRKGALDW